MIPVNVGGLLILGMFRDFIIRFPNGIRGAGGE